MNVHNTIDVAQLSANLQFAFKRDLQKKIANVREAWDSYIDSNCSAEKLQSLESDIDKLVHAANTFGAYRIAESARQLAEYCKQSISHSDSGEQNVVAESKIHLEKLLASIGDATKDWCPKELSPEAKGNILSNRQNPYLYLFVKDQTLRSELLAALININCELRLINDDLEFEAAILEQVPAVIVADFQLNDGDGGDDLTTLLDFRQNSPALIYLSHDDSFSIRMKALQAGAFRYFSKPFNTGGIAQSVKGIVSTPTHNPYRVLIVDDDELSLKFYAAAMHRFELEVKTLTDPTKTIDVMYNFKPEVVMLDLNMPTCSGEDLARIIRQDSNWSNISIMFLSVESDMERQLEALSYGGDDFISKSSNLNQLISSVTARAKRARQCTQLHNELKSALRENEYFISAVDQHDILSVADVAGRIIYVNDKFTEISGYKREELLGQNHRLLKSGMHPRQFYQEMWNTISNGSIWRGTICNRKKNGRTYWVESTIVPFMDNKGKPYKYVSVRTDISDIQENEIRFKSSQVFANIGTWDWDIKTGDLYWSERVGPLLGYTREVPETTYENFIAAVHPEDRKSISDAINDCIVLGQKYDIEHRVVWPDGSVHWVHESGDVVRNESGEPLHMLGVIQDINLRKTAEQTLLERERLLKEAQSIAGIGNWKLDVFSGNLVWSDQLYRIFGYEPGRFEPNLLNFYSSVHVDDLDDVKKAMVSAEQTGFSDVVYRIVRPDGKMRYVHELGRAEKDKTGNFICLTGTIQDITQRIEAETALIQAREEAENANRAKSQFLSSMSHELRTPLNAIIGFGQLMRMESNGNLTPSQMENLDEITNAGTHLMELINQVLDLSKIEAGRVELKLETLSVGDLIGESLNLIQPLAQRRQVILTSDYQGRILSDMELLDLPLEIWADRTRVRQSLLNLLSNAVKYNKEGGKVQVSIEKTDKNYIHISVSDTGNGMTELQQSEIFTSFKRFAESESDVEGTGIGLVITKKLVELMRGEIGFSSKVGQGSTFWIDLPEACAEQETEPMIDDLKSMESHAAKNVSNIRNILYIEDNPANLRLVTQLLGRLPFVNMASAHEPLLGLELAEKIKPDLILLDITLPSMDGFEVLRRLRQIDATTKTPVIAISANAMAEDIKAGLDAGFCQYITKPIDVNAFLTSVKSVLYNTESGIE